jgi:rhodanese-related sulfurtransferase
MHVYIEFLYRHWELSLAFIGVVAALIFTELRKTPGNSVSPQQAVDLMNHQHASIIDIRSYETYKTGHIVGAISMPISELSDKLKKFTKSTKKPVVVVCANGQTSQHAITKFTEHGFATVVYVAGGLQAWTTEGLPLIRE